MSESTAISQLGLDHSLCSSIILYPHDRLTEDHLRNLIHKTHVLSSSPHGFSICPLSALRSEALEQSLYRVYLVRKTVKPWYESGETLSSGHLE